jgi:tetrahydromethanopterin S-methyltransferase subunit F
MDSAKTKVGEIKDSAKDKTEKAAKLSGTVAKGAGKVALGIVSAPVILGVAGAKEAYYISRDVAGGIQEAAKNVVGAVGDKVSETKSQVQDRRTVYHQKKSARHSAKARRIQGSEESN